MNTISNLLNWNLSEIQELNPVFKTTYIPSGSCLTGPQNIILEIVEFEDSLYKLESNYYQKKYQPVINKTIKIDSTNTDTLKINLSVNKEQKRYYTVKTGDSLYLIARKNYLTFEQLKKLNPGINNIIHTGQKIRVK
jgi:membrane-bound lytic murein transglycosylase D